jgi:hypothetical protein
MYEGYIHRATPLAEIDKMAETGGRPSTLFRLDTSTNCVVDDYILPHGFTSSSPQFVPRKGGDPGSDTDGYITLMVFCPDPPGGEATPELWVFDAADLSKGPVCMLRHPSFKIGLTIHTAWLGALQHDDPSVYKVDIAEDLGTAFSNRRRGWLKKVFEEEILPKFGSAAARSLSLKAGRKAPIGRAAIGAAG